MVRTPARPHDRRERAQRGREDLGAGLRRCRQQQQADRLDSSAGLFTGRAALIEEIKGDGRFDLYALGNNGYSFRVDKGILMAVISAGK